MLMLLSALGSTADNFLMPQLNFLARLFRLSPDVAGVTLLAVGNAAPDVFSAIAVATSDLGSSKQELDLSFMLSDIIGGTLFINTVVVGNVVWAAGRRTPGWTVGQLPFWRDLSMLFVAVTFVLLIASHGSISLVEACCLLVLHAVYIGTVILLPKLLLHRCSHSDSRADTNSGGNQPGTNAMMMRGSEQLQVQVCCNSHLMPLSAALLSDTRHSSNSISGDRHRSGVGDGSSGTGSADGVSGGVSGGANSGGNVRAHEQSREEPQARQHPVVTSPPAQGGFIERGSGHLIEPGPGALAQLGDISKPFAPEGHRETMVGLDWPQAGSSRLTYILHVLELPMSVLRWCTIPASDGCWDRSRRLWNCASAPFVLLLFSTQIYGDVPGATSARVGGSLMPMPALLLVVGCVASAALWLATCDERPPKWYPVLVLSGFVMTIVWLKVLAGEAVALVETIGILLHISTSILGLTVMAVGNSIGDLVADTAAAREGTVSGARMGLAACFGSPVIMNIVSVGCAFTLRLALTCGRPIRYGALSKLTRLGYLLFYWTLVSHVVIFPLGGYRAPRLYAVYLILIYASLLTLSCLIEAGMIEFTWLCTSGSFIFGQC